MTTPTVVLGEAHCIVRESVKSLLESRSSIRVIGESGDGLDLLRLAEQLQPDALVTDLTLPGVNGFEVLRQLPQRSVRTAGVVLTAHSNEEHVLEALRCGARGYVLKQASVRDLVLAIEETVAGRRYLSPPLGDRAFELYSNRATDASLRPLENLTTREREILQLAATGLTNGRIAERLCISPRTVETHRTHLMQKLCLQSHIDLVRFSLKHELVSLE